MVPSRETAEEMAIEVLGWMAARDDLMWAFLDASGTDAEGLRARLQDAEFLGFLLDFLMTSDDMVKEFARDTRRDPASLMAARAALPGGDMPNWT